MVFSYKIAVLLSPQGKHFLFLVACFAALQFPYYGEAGILQGLTAFQLASLFPDSFEAGGSAAVTGIVFGLEYGNSHFAEIQFSRLLVHPLYLCVHTGLEKRKGSAF